MNEARPCIAKKMLDSIDPNDDRSHEIIRDATGITFGGKWHRILLQHVTVLTILIAGADTVSSSRMPASNLQWPLTKW
jgi:hypothetical protein